MGSKVSSEDTSCEQLRSYVVAVEVAADNRADPPPVPPSVAVELLNAESPVNYSKGDKYDPCCDTYSLLMKENVGNIKQCQFWMDMMRICLHRNNQWL